MVCFLCLSVFTYDIYFFPSGKDSFFRAHQDTPRGAKMFGSLVLVFPTPHEGGSLVLRHEGKEWSFDSAKVLAEQPSPSIGYVAFFSDVEHEVLPVKSGYRVTITYNLYFGDGETKKNDRNQWPWRI